MSNEEVQDRHAGDGFFWGGERILRGLKPGLLRFCNYQGSRFISTQGRLAFDSRTVLIYGVPGKLSTRRRHMDDKATNQELVEIRRRLVILRNTRERRVLAFRQTDR